MRTSLGWCRTVFFMAFVGVGVSTVMGQTGDRVVGLLEKLSNAAGPPGAEEPVRAIMVGEMKPLATEAIRYDGTGSVIAQQGATGPRIMIDAHMDELGGMAGSGAGGSAVDHYWFEGAGACGDGDSGHSCDYAGGADSSVCAGFGLSGCRREERCGCCGDGCRAG